jgi:hypothetical protein
VSRWTYASDGGELYDVAAGDVWRCGDHRFRCGSMMDPDVEAFAADATLVYADPPWNAGNLSSFYTKAGKSKPMFGWIDVYQRIFELAGERPCFVEGGVQQIAQVEAVVDARYYQRWPIRYYRRHDAVLHYVGPTPPPSGFDPSGLDDERTPLAVLVCHAGGIVFDPCAGRGLTSRSAAQLGWWHSLNNELHPNRLSAALTALHRQTALSVGREEHVDA